MGKRPTLGRFRRICENLGVNREFAFFLENMFFSSQQVSGFFSRLAAKIRKDSATEAEKPESDDDEQQNVVEAESLH